MSSETEVFVPGHITGFFTAHPDDDLTKAGSRGAGLTLTDGVTVTVSPATDPEIVLDGQPVDLEPVETVLSTLEAVAHVEIESALPLGAGFGVSGAAALGTALAVNHVFDRKLSENELVTIAHGAEVRAETGLGDVVAQARGGVPIRLEPGSPEHNYIDAIPARARVEYHTFGELSTADVLGGETDALTRAGRESLSLVVEEPTLSSFIYASRRFARETELLTEPVIQAISDVADVGGEASMAMLGETVFALGTGLTDAGYDPSVCATHPAGAMLR